MTRRTAAFLLLTGAVPAYGQGSDASDDGPAHGRIRHVEASVALQRPDEQGAEEAVPNTPFLPGDRLWSDASGRAELQFPDGSAVRLDSRSKLDYLEHEAGRNDELVVLSLGSGSITLRVRDDRRRADFVIETPDGRVEAREAGSYRVDVLQDETRLRVYEGTARLESGRRSVLVESDETALARRDEPPSPASEFDADDADDDFARWDDERGQLSWQADSLRYLPEEVQPYATDFDTYGQWHYEAEVGYVWRPRVTSGWRPYSDGRWTWTSYGWTWVPFESWGWAPSHYGRWGRSVSLGWYWIPGRRFSPAWVSWRAGGDYVGWCPLGRGDRAVGEPGGYRGVAVPRGAGAPGGGAHWTYARRADMSARGGARRRFELDAAGATQTAPVDARWRLNRELRPVEREHAVARTPRTRPTPGDFVPQLRYDPLTTIPPPAQRRRPTEDRHDTRQGGEARTTARATAGEPAEQRQPARRDASAAQRPRTAGTSAAAGRSTSTGGEREPDAAARRGPRAPSDDPDVLRHFFAPLVEPRSDAARTERKRDAQDGQHAERSGSGADAEQRAPRRAAPQREREQAPAPKPPASSSSSSSSSGDGGAKERQPSRSRDRQR